MYLTLYINFLLIINCYSSLCLKCTEFVNVIFIFNNKNVRGAYCALWCMYFIMNYKPL